MKSSQRRNMNRLKGFTLTEILVAVLIMAIVAGSVMMLGYTYFKHFEQANEITIAKDRATMVLTYLERRILHTGLGMPVSADEFASAFEELLDHIDDWETAIDSPEEGQEDINILRIAYAVPSGIFSISSGDVDSSITSTSINVSGLNLGLIEDDQTKTKGWVVFPSVKRPLKVDDLSNSSTPKTISLSLNGSKRRVPINDQLHYVRFMEAFVEGGTFKIEEFTLGNGRQPIVEGILDCRFSLDENRVLTVSVLARGSKEYSSLVSPASIPGWGAIGNDEWRKYYLVVLSKGWRVRN